MLLLLLLNRCFCLSLVNCFWYYCLKMLLVLVLTSWLGYYSLSTAPATSAEQLLILLLFSNCSCYYCLSTTPAPTTYQSAVLPLPISWLYYYSLSTACATLRIKLPILLVIANSAACHGMETIALATITTTHQMSLILHIFGSAIAYHSTYLSTANAIDD